MYTCLPFLCKRVSKPSFWIFLLFLLLGAGSPRSISAAVFDDIGSGQILFKDSSGSYLSALHLESHAEIQVSGIVAHVRLKQTFRNHTAQWQEATYVLPMNETAAVTEMTMTIGERVIRAEIKEKQEARKIYQKARSEGRKAALTEQNRPNLFRQTVANIAPGEAIELELKFVQAVDYDGGEFSIRLPMTLTPRYFPGVPVTEMEQSFTVGARGWAVPTTEVPDAQLISPPMVPITGEGVINPISVSVKLDPGLELKQIASPYHQISVKRHKDIYQVELVDGIVAMDRDYVLKWEPVIGAAPKAAVFRETIAGEDYVLLMMLPPDQDHDVQALPRDMVFVIDTSGSMQGSSIEQARSSLMKALDSLRPEDRFNVIEFNSSWSRLFSGMQPADLYNLRQAKDWVSRLVAGGGTEMYPALVQALASEESEHYLKHIIFVTDGAVGNEGALLELLTQNLGSARMFPVGIGSAPNGFFMRQSAKFGRGTYVHVGDIGEVEEKMDALFKKIDSPVATDLVVAWPGEVESYPSKIPAIYRGEPLLIVAKASSLNGEIQISGVTARMPWHQSLPLESKLSQPGVGTLWARRKLEALEDDKIRGKDSEIVKKEMVEIALAHSLVSRYTSLVAVEDIVSRLPEERLESRAIPNLLAKGQVQHAMYPRTATRATASFVLAMVSFLLAVIALMYRRVSLS